MARDVASELDIEREGVGTVERITERFLAPILQGF